MNLQKLIDAIVSRRLGNDPRRWADADAERDEVLRGCAVALACFAVAVIATAFFIGLGIARAD